MFWLQVALAVVPEQVARDLLTRYFGYLTRPNGNVLVENKEIRASKVCLS